MTKIERTQDAALRILLEIRNDVIENQDENVRSLLSEGLIREVFSIAWRYQFEEDRHQVRKALNQLVNDAISEKKLDRDK